MKYPFIYIFTILSIILGSGATSFSRNLLTSDLFESDDLSFDVTMTEEEFISGTKLYKENPFGDELLSYKVRLPKDWKMVSKANLENVSLNSWVLGDVTRIVSPPIGDDRATFIVRALEMQRYMSIDNWFRSFISVQGGFISNIKVFSPNLVHAEYSILENGKNYFTRAVIQRSVNRVILAEYKVPIVNASEYNNTQKWTMSLFRLGKIDYSYDRFSEVLDYLGIAEHMYPKGWIVKSGKYDSIKEIWYTVGREQTSEHRRNKIDYSRGAIKTLLISKVVYKGYEARLKEIMDKEDDYVFESKKLEEFYRGVGNKGSTVAFHPTRVYSPKSIDDNENQEYWIGVNETSEHYFIVYMKIPSRNFHYNLWSENVGAFNLILATLKPMK